MKNITHPRATSPATASQNRAPSNSPMPPSPLSSEILLNIGAMFTANQVAMMLGESEEAIRARGVMAGIVATLKEILPPDQFKSVLIQWEVDAIALTELLEIANAELGETL